MALQYAKPIRKKLRELAGLAHRGNRGAECCELRLYRENPKFNLGSSHIINSGDKVVYGCQILAPISPIFYTMLTGLPLKGSGLFQSHRFQLPFFPACVAFFPLSFFSGPILSDVF